MKPILTSFSEGLNAVLYYLKAAVAAVTNNTALLATSVFLLLTMGKSLKLGRFFNYKG